MSNKTKEKESTVKSPYEKKPDNQNQDEQKDTNRSEKDVENQ